MSCTLADLDHARREVLDIEARVAEARTRIDLIERRAGDTTDARVLLKHLEKAKRQSVERLGSVRNAIGPSAY